MQHGLHSSYPMRKLSPFMKESFQSKSGSVKSVPFSSLTEATDSTLPPPLCAATECCDSEQLLEYEEETDEEDHFLDQFDDPEDDQFLNELLNFDDDRPRMEPVLPAPRSSPMLDDTLSVQSVPREVEMIDQSSQPPSSPMMMAPLVDSDPILDGSDCEGMNMDIDNYVNVNSTMSGSSVVCLPMDINEELLF